MKEEIRIWWEKSKRDIDNAHFNFKWNRYEEACFFAQQSIEKALKSLDIKLTGTFIRHHDLVFLAKKVQAPDGIIDKCRKLKPVYIETRYPDLLPATPYTKEKTIGILEVAEQILKWIKEKLNI